MSENVNHVELDSKFSQWLFRGGSPLTEGYPDFYGGNFFDEKEGYTFFLRDVPGISNIKNEIRKLIPDAGFEVVPYEYQTLYKYYQFLNENKAFEKGFPSYYVDDERGAVVISAGKDPDECRYQFQKNFDIPDYLMFEKEEPLKEETKVGERLNTNVGISSLGFPARDAQGQTGFVTTQHAYNSGANWNGIFRDATGNQIGIIVSGLHRGNTDACFVINANNHRAERAAAFGCMHLISHATPRCLKVPVAKYGFSTQCTYGRILSFFHTNNGIMNQYYSNYHSAGGDSGGAVTCCGFVIGIHTAGGRNRNGEHRTSVCKYKYISRNLQVNLA